MGSLQTSANLSCLCVSVRGGVQGFSTVVRQVGFNSWLLQGRIRSRKIQSLCVRSSFNNAGGSSSSEEKGLLLGAERDSSGSVVGFQLIPHSVTGDATIVESHDIVADDRDDLSEDAEQKEKPPTKLTFNIIFVTAEAAPYSKTGGLGDVCGSLPVALASRGHRVMVVSPRYLNGGPSDEKYANTVDLDVRATIHCFGGPQEVAFYHEYRAGVDWKYTALAIRYLWTTLLIADLERHMVIFMVHLVIIRLLAAKYRPYGVYKDARSIVLIHNIAHQGVEPAATYHNLGLPPEWYGALEWIFPTWARAHALDTGETVNVLKGAVAIADRILTVSQGYSWEITTPEGGYGLHELLSSRKSVLNGITNGIDVSDWNPSTDEHTASHYSIRDLSGKVKCKTALQKELGLPIRPDCPLIGFIGRLDYQKGVDIILSAIPELMQDDVQFVMLGSGEKQYEDWMRHTENLFKDKFRGWVGFNVPVSHRITAGCDILLMPSRFEPCGLNQLYAMRYGTIPVVHSTGGLRDTVKDFNPYAQEGEGEGTGWTFSPLSREKLLDTLKVAISTYIEHKSSWEGLMKRGMERDYSWENAAIQYEQVFEWAFIDPPYVR
ncbi:soluble starch synthase 1, chloroplastic/amyloplastic isoform X4 [Nicotiana tabacum]